MKTFVETVREEENPQAQAFPTFSDAIKGEIEESFNGKDNVSKSFETLHGLQLELQDLQNKMLELRDKFLSYEKGSPERKPIEVNMLEIGKKKKDLEKKIHDAEVATQRAIANDDAELEDIDFL